MSATRTARGVANALKMLIEEVYVDAAVPKKLEEFAMLLEDLGDDAKMSIMISGNKTKLTAADFIEEVAVHLQD